MNPLFEIFQEHSIEKMDYGGNKTILTNRIKVSRHFNRSNKNMSLYKAVM